MAATGTAVEVGYPTAEQSAVMSPTSPACVPQDHLEAVLGEHFRSLPNARIELDAWRLSGVTQSAGRGPT